MQICQFSIFEKALEAVQFHKKLSLSCLKQPSIARKRLLRKRFKRVCNNLKIEDESCLKKLKFTTSLLRQIEHIFDSQYGNEFVSLINSIYAGENFFVSENFTLTFKKRCNNNHLENDHNENSTSSVLNVSK